MKKTIKSFKNRGTLVCETIGRWVIHLYRNIRFHICNTYVVFQVERDMVDLHYNSKMEYIKDKGKGTEMKILEIDETMTEWIH